ncbi:MAG: molybdenum cofactor biosynthesis protein MoaE [bacterium]|nr:molybdenum cofactor biosynthesis protein MoaE [bacterium]
MIKVQVDNFNIANEIDELKQIHQDLGAIVSFTGVVRGGSGDQKITSMVLEHYPGMTERELSAIETKARARWQLIDCLIIHRYGTLVPGDNIVLVVTISKHRNDAFQAASFLMDYLKTSAPFWKKELDAEELGNWVKAKQEDQEATKSWQNTAEHEKDDE